MFTDFVFDNSERNRKLKCKKSWGQYMLQNNKLKLDIDLVRTKNITNVNKYSKTLFQNHQINNGYKRLSPVWEFLHLSCKMLCMKVCHSFLQCIFLEHQCWSVFDFNYLQILFIDRII